MQDSIRFKLHFGPYRMPRVRVGQRVQCEVLGDVKVHRLSDAPIPWPITRRSLVIYSSLARAIRMESIVAVAHHWGVATQTVTRWRRVLGIKGEPVGTSVLRTRYAGEPWARKALKKTWSKARDPQRREKIAAARRGKPRPAHVIEALRKANRGRPLSAEHRRKLSAIRKARGIRPPWLNPPWEPWEDELVRTLPKAKAAAKTGRTLSAVKGRRHVLGVRG